MFECRVDSGSWVDCTSPWTTAPLSDGAHTRRGPRDRRGGQHRRLARDALVHGRHRAAARHDGARHQRSRRARRARRRDNTPTFAFTASEANSVFECRVDSGGLGRLHQPVDDRRPRRRRAHGVASARPTWRATPTPRPRRARSPSTPPRRRRRTRRPPTRRSARARPARRRATTASFAFTSSESGLDLRVQARYRRLGDLHEPEGLQRSDDRLAHLQRARHRRRGQHRRHAGDADLDDPERAGRPPAGGRLHLQPGLADRSARPSRSTRPARRATTRRAPTRWEDDGGDGPAGDQWPLGSGKTMSFTFQEAGVKNVRVTVTDVDGDTATTMKAITVGAAAPPADTTAPDTTISSGPTGTTQRQHADLRASRRARADRRSSASVDSGAWASCTSPWTTSDAGRRPAQRVGPRHRRRGATSTRRRRPARSPSTRRLRPTRTAPNTTIGSGPTGPTNDTHPDVRVHRERERLDVPVPRRHRLVGELHQPVDDGRAGRRRAQRLGPRDRRRRQHRRLPGDALVHRRHVRPRTPRSTRRRPSSRRARARRWRSAPASPAPRSSAGSTAGRGPHARRRRPTPGSASAQHTVDVRATDAAGNVEAVAGHRCLDVDRAHRRRVRAPDGQRIRFRRIRFRFGRRGADGDALGAVRGLDVHLDAEHGGHRQRQPRREPGRVLVRRGARVPGQHRPVRGAPSPPGGRRPTACTRSPSGPSTPPGTRARPRSRSRRVRPLRPRRTGPRASASARATRRERF